jgi:Methyltransferase domain
MVSARVASPHVVIGFADGSIWIHCSDSNQGVQTTDLELLRTLALFAAPSELEAVAAASAFPEAVRSHVAVLEGIGALVHSEAGAPAKSAEPPSGELVHELLRPLAVLVDDLAGLLAAVGPAVSEEIREESGIGLRARLTSCLAAVQGLRTAVEARLPGWVKTQLEGLHLPARGLSIHVGSGSARLDGWVNLDVWPAELSLDLRRGLPFADGSADRVYLSHVLEHLVYPQEATQLLREIHRVLAPGGTVRIIVPDIGACIDGYVNDDRRFFEGRRAVWPDWDIQTRLESFLGFAGVGPYPGFFGLSHKWGYDFETLAHVLERSGFQGVVRSTYQGSAQPEFRVDHASSYAGANVDGRYYSLFVEARR